MDIVYVEGLNVSTVVGVYSWEQKIKQRLVVDVEMACDTRLAAKSDDIQFSIDYAAVCQRVIEHIEKGRFALVERVAEEVANLLLSQFDVAGVRVRINKPDAIPQAKALGVIIERGHFVR